MSKDDYTKLSYAISGKQKGHVIKAEATGTCIGDTSVILQIDLGTKRPSWYNGLMSALNRVDSSIEHLPIFFRDDNDTMVTSHWIRVRVPMKFLDCRPKKQSNAKDFIDYVTDKDIEFLVWRPQYDHVYQKVSLTVSRINVL